MIDQATVSIPSHIILESTEQHKHILTIVSQNYIVDESIKLTLKRIILQNVQ